MIADWIIGYYNIRKWGSKIIKKQELRCWVHMGRFRKPILQRTRLICNFDPLYMDMPLEWIFKVRSFYMHVLLFFAKKNSMP